MKQITLHNLPEDIELIARMDAEKRGVSLGEAILTLLRKAVDRTSCRTRGEGEVRDIGYFCGKWSDAEADSFDGHLKEQRRIDEEVWAAK